MYTPRLSENLVRRFYPVCREVGVPMTVFANGAMERAILRAEEYVAMGDGERVLDMIGVCVSEDVVGEQVAAGG